MEPAKAQAAHSVPAVALVVVAAVVAARLEPLVAAVAVPLVVAAVDLAVTDKNLNNRYNSHITDNNDDE